MSPPNRRHPAQVYWRRRLVFVVIPALIIVAIGWAFTSRGFGGRAATEHPATTAPPSGGLQKSASAVIPKVDVPSAAVSQKQAGKVHLAGFSTPVWPVLGQAALSISGRGSLGTSGSHRRSPSPAWPR